MRRAFLFLAFLMIGLAAQAQQWPFEFWHEGRIVLLEGDTLKGTIKYDPEKDIVQFSDNAQKVEAFSARKVLFYEIFDVTINRYRQFFALPYSATSTYKAPVFFELLEEGKMTLLSREALEYRSYNSPYYIGSYSKLILVYKYFFLQENGDITEFIGNKNDLLDLMGKRSEEVEKYMKTNKLKYDDKDDLVKIVTYYNSLFGT